MPHRMLPIELPPASVDLGKFAYETYLECWGHLGLRDNPWDDLPAEVRNAWTNTAQAIIDTRPDVRFVARIVEKTQS